MLFGDVVGAGLVGDEPDQALERVVARFPAGRSEVALQRLADVERLRAARARREPLERTLARVVEVDLLATHTSQYTSLRLLVHAAAPGRRTGRTSEHDAGRVDLGQQLVLRPRSWAESLPSDTGACTSCRRSTRRSRSSSIFDPEAGENAPPFEGGSVKTSLRTIQAGRSRRQLCEVVPHRPSERPLEGPGRPAALSLASCRWPPTRSARCSRQPSRAGRSTCSTAPAAVTTSR